MSHVHQERFYYSNPIANWLRLRLPTKINNPEIKKDKNYKNKLPIVVIMMKLLLDATAKITPHNKLNHW
jgi:hypothetical protein